MSDNIDFKTLWNKQGASDAPDTKELFIKADSLKKRSRNGLIRLNLVLLATVVVVGYVGFNVDKEQLTTKIGVILIFVAIASYLIAYNQMIPMLFKTNPEASSKEYLEQLISIKRRLEFLNKVMINIYFVLLSLGLALYMLQFAMRMSVAWSTFYYMITFAWIAFAWFYIRPRGMRKKQKPLNDLIARLEAVNEQLRDGD